MPDSFSLLTADWFLNKAAVGYALRFIERIALGNVVLAGVAYHVRNETVLGLCAYAVSAVLAFVAIDLRHLLRRTSKC